MLGFLSITLQACSGVVKTQPFNNTTSSNFCTDFVISFSVELHSLVRKDATTPIFYRDMLKACFCQWLTFSFPTVVNILQNQGGFGFGFGINIFLQLRTCMDSNASTTLYQGITHVSKLYPSRRGYLTRSAMESSTEITKRDQPMEALTKLSKIFTLLQLFPLKTLESMAATSIYLKLVIRKNLNCSNTALFNRKFIFLLPIWNEKQMKIYLIPS